MPAATGRIRSILVPEAQAIGQIAVIRSLGAAGYRILAASEDPDALGFASRYVAHPLVCPPANQPALYRAWLDAVLAQEGVDLIIPSESLVLALRDCLADYAPLLPMGPDAQAIQTAFSKFDLFQRFLAPDAPPALRDRLPPCWLWRAGDALPDAAALAALGPEVWLKADGLHGLCPRDDGEVVAAPAAAVPARLAELSRHYDRVLLQGAVPGMGTGVFLLRWQGRIVAEFMYRGLHETPHRGGNSTLRESWWQEDQYRDALARLEHLGWDGMYMFEYRFDADTGRSALIEVNSRFWMSLHLALYAGVDFPRLLLEAVQGRWPERPERARRQACARYTVPGELTHLLSKLKDPGLALSGKLAGILEFVALGLSPAVLSDLAWPGDEGVGCRAWRRLLRDGLHRH